MKTFLYPNVSSIRVRLYLTWVLKICVVPEWLLSWVECHYGGGGCCVAAGTSVCCRPCSAVSSSSSGSAPWPQGETGAPGPPRESVFPQGTS